jgi:glycosyltransferase involved in cell wall biosynthesis
MNRTVLFVAPAAFPLGGVAVWLDYLLPGLESHGWRCFLGLTQGQHHDAAAYLDRHPWPRACLIANATGSAEGRVRAIADVIDTVRADLLAAVNLPAAYEAVRRLRGRGRPAPKTVLTLHALQQDILSDVAANADVLDAVIGTNKLAVRIAADYLARAERVFYASCGVPLRAAIPTRRAIEPGRVKLLYAGRIEQKQKRVLDLVELVGILRRRGLKFQLDIAGAGPDESALRLAIQAAGASTSVCFLGDLSPEALAREYANHDALLITSSWETGPIVAWEAMSHGLPVLSSDYIGSGAEGGLSHGQNCLLFPVGNMVAAADAVGHLLAGASTRERLTSGGLELVRSRYSVGASVRMWSEALGQVLLLPALPAPSMVPPTAKAGRLDRWFGIWLGERVRRSLGVRFQHAGPGGEWPHTMAAPGDERSFLESARKLDQQHAQ